MPVRLRRPCPDPSGLFRGTSAVGTARPTCRGSRWPRTPRRWRSCRIRGDTHRGHEPRPGDTRATSSRTAIGARPCQARNEISARCVFCPTKIARTSSRTVAPTAAVQTPLVRVGTTPSGDRSAPTSAAGPEGVAGWSAGAGTGAGGAPVGRPTRRVDRRGVPLLRGHREWRAPDARATRSGWMAVGTPVGAPLPGRCTAASATRSHWAASRKRAFTVERHRAPRTTLPRHVRMLVDEWANHPVQPGPSVLRIDSGVLPRRTAVRPRVPRSVGVRRPQHDTAVRACRARSVRSAPTISGCSQRFVASVDPRSVRSRQALGWSLRASHDGKPQ